MSQTVKVILFVSVAAATIYLLWGGAGISDILPIPQPHRGPLE